MKISFNQACTLHNSNLENDLRLCEEVGFDAIELRTDKVREYLQTHSMDELKAFFQTHHLKPYSINGIYVYTDFLSERDDPKKTAELLAEIDFACYIGKELSCDKMIMVPPVFKEEENRTYDDPWEKIVEDNVRIFTKMCDYVGRTGMKIGIEIVGAPRSSIRTVKQCNEIIDRVGKANLGYTIDAYNLYLYHKTNDFRSILEAYPEKVYIVHLNGGEESPDGVFLQKYRTPANRGIVNVKDFLTRLHEIGYDDYVSIEFFRQDFWDMTAEEAIRECYESSLEVVEDLGFI